MWLWSSNQAFGHLGCPSLIILFFLREDKMRKKLFLALIALTACCGYGCAEDEGGATCTDGERRCYGEHSQVCKDGAYTTEKCTMGCDAVSGKCNTSPATPEICDDGKFQCADGKLEKCVSNAWVKQEECPADRCDATAGKCNPAADKVCDDGKFQCADGKLNKCVSNAWVKQEECPADRCDATAGKCNTDNPPADKCTNDTFKCENEKLYKCENESWNAGTACPAATHTCNAEATDEASACVEKSTEPPAEKCTNGKFKCENDKLYKCENESWNAGTACPAAKCNAETGVCNEEQPPADKCETGKFKCENDKLFKCENESWDAGTACPAAKCNADTGMCDEEQPQLEKCTATSTKKCEATCNSDKKEGYYWGGKNAVKVNCSNNNCYASSDKAFVGCGTEVPYCEAGSKDKCQKKCLDDGSKGYYWNKELLEYVCENKDCMISSNNRVVCESEEIGDTKVTCTDTSKVACETGNMMVKYCDKTTKTYWIKGCHQCNVNTSSTIYYCDGKVPCKKGDKTKCINSCAPNNEKMQYIWNSKTNSVDEKSCTGNKVCEETASGTKCVTKK